MRLRTDEIVIMINLDFYPQSSRGTDEKLSRMLQYQICILEK